MSDRLPERTGITSTMPCDLTATTEAYVVAIEAELRHWLASPRRVGRHYDLLGYHMGWLDESFATIDAPKGKRFRPLLCLLCCRAVGGVWQDALPLAAAIEFLHNFSLIHDDIEDHDETRHHRPSLWKLAGEPLAINAGDAMLALSGIVALSSPKASSVAQGLEETALALTEGQYLDMTFESQEVVSIDEYFRMIGLKTGALITFACEAGALVGNGSRLQIEACRRFGHHFGVAFQLFDDIRGIWGATIQTGKAEGTDIVNRKKSLPVLLALQRASGTNHDVLDHYYSHEASAHPVDIRNIFDSLNVLPDTRQVLRQNFREAVTALTSVGMEHQTLEVIECLALGLVGNSE